MAVNVTPARFEPKTEEEVIWYGIDWAPQLLNGETIESVTWTVHPNAGLAIVDQDIVDGTIVRAKIGGGTAGTTYYVRSRATLAETGEVLEASSGDTPGINLEVLGFPIRGGGVGTLRDDYGRGPY